MRIVLYLFSSFQFGWHRVLNLPGMNSNQPSAFMRRSAWAVLLVGAGVLMGAVWSGKGRSPEEDQIVINSIKFRELLSLIHTDYIDPTNTDSLADAALESLVEELDPHSSYVPRQEVFATGVQLESNFEGIGAEFQFIDDTIWVTSVVADGPSQRAGLVPGDKIISVDHVPVSGVRINPTDLTRLVRGPKGTRVVLQISRFGEKETVPITLFRDKIQSHSVDFVDMPGPGVGLIKCRRFTHGTHLEMREALQTLLQNGMKSLILDLRDNSGGYVSAAVRVADEFLRDRQLIVYTEGRNPEHNSRTYATEPGLFEEGNLCVLINENTASAAEIVTGALQDNDRALVIGRRSFGKGLVQAPITLTDGSELRLTISRYFTPSGRCIQKGYQRRRRQAYFREYEDRTLSSEMFCADSIRLQGRPVFKTQKGRKVYGGGGIIPDVFASRDSVFQPDWMSRVVDKPVLYAFILQYLNQNRKKFEHMSEKEFIRDFILGEQDLEQFRDHLQSFGAGLSPRQFEKGKPGFSLFLKAGLAKCLWQYQGFYKVLNGQDHEVAKALFFAPRSGRTLQNMASGKPAGRTRSEM